MTLSGNELGYPAGARIGCPSSPQRPIITCSPRIDHVEQSIATAGHAGERATVFDGVQSLGMARFQQKISEDEVSAARQKIAAGASLRSAAAEIPCAPSTLSGNELGDPAGARIGCPSSPQRPIITCSPRIDHVEQSMQRPDTPANVRQC